MDYKKNIKEYYSAITDRAENFNAEVPYTPEDELLQIKKRANKRRQVRMRSYAAAAASVAVLAVCISSVDFKPSEPVKMADKAEKAYSSNSVPVVSSPVPQVVSEEADNLILADAPTETEAVQKVQTVPQYTHVPQITMPPMPEIEYTEPITPPVQAGESYQLGVYYAKMATPAPEISISENENIPSGSAMKASSGAQSSAEDDLWSEEEYFAYLGKNPIEGIDVPADLVKSAAEEKYMLRDENGEFINDKRTFTYANHNRTRLLNITTSKSPISNEKHSSTDINGIKVSVFDNHMSHTALLEGNGLYISAEIYGLTQAELMDIVYSLSERMAS